jgi:hypothetical protein
LSIGANSDGEYGKEDGFELHDGNEIVVTWTRMIMKEKMLDVKWKTTTEKTFYTLPQ